ncbi:hypothetical protein B484DRAFT_443343 [Ochromonadaceae sp. CCMP2298]|nr:hypothetical protein B484DRAFT_443343 [Ochromonadaceae sp. CCMP2298]|eukprot:CAMPEP_0173184954 /NCGR_PEP_ID=MMETSP1141-20130122/9266_1 /TAXON_ID=483371 /ORGANISM="non described non described, Strain CCMP2298" /LENGTH=940 /DNA_ID=CAMNT_0014108389 /DNA_START=26 /DNA_END=2848 /DNA_ORIENTATION=+
MASVSGKVAPGLEEDEAEDDEFNVVEEEDGGEEDIPAFDRGGSSQMKTLVRQVMATKQVNYFQSLIDYNSIKSNVRWFMETATCTISFTVEDVTFMMTLFVLFGDDIKLLSAPRTVDADFAVAYAVCLFAFIFELVVNSWSRTEVTALRPRLEWEGYLFSFFWWLDLIAILTMFADVDFIGEPLGISDMSNNVAGGNSNYGRAGRVIRLVRLVRLVKLYKVASEKRIRHHQENELLELVKLGVIRHEDIARQRALYGERQSRLGDQLSESTTRRVIIMVLVLIIIIPLLIPSFTNDGPEFAMTMLHKFNVDSDVSEQAKQAVLLVFNTSLAGMYNDRFVDKLVVSPLSAVNPSIYFPGNLDSLRAESKLEYSLYTNNSQGYFITEVVYNIDPLVREFATFSIVTTIFVAVMLIGGSIVFTNDAQRLVIEPIERMMNMVEAVAEDPLATFQFEEEGGNALAQYETKLLETTIEKITGLLRVGFGEAGAGIISANLSSKDSSTAINPLLPGIRIYAIFGFCDIHHFEDINQKLSNDVLVFVNHIAEIVHNNVHTWSGQCNKNLGNAFVIVWRIGDEEQLTRNAQRGRQVHKNDAEMLSSFTSSKSPKLRMQSRNALEVAAAEEEEKNKKRSSLIDLRRVPGVDILADQALIGYLKIIAEINRSKYILRYRTEPRLTDKGKTPFKVRMGFGLHAGWAIEGAVGSLQKVDATYLSPHVNMAARLESSSKQYGVPLLASQDFFDLMSFEGQCRCRRLDVITVKGSEVPIGIYTYDALQDQEFKENTIKRNPSINMLMSSGSNNNTPFSGGVSGKESGGTGSGTSSPQRRLSTPLIGLGVTDRPVVFFTPDDLTADVFEGDYDLVTLRKHAVDLEFQNTFKEGVELYLNGDWAAAKGLLERADIMMSELAPVLGGDGPSRTLLSYMKNRNFEAPKTWKGFRPLTSK